ILTTLQIAITVGLLYFVFRDPAKRAQMATALRMANYWWIVAGIGVYLIVELAAAIRFQVLLRVQDIRLSNTRVGALFIIGMFYNQFMPGGTGGDIIKSYLLIKETPGKVPGALLAVLFDRLIGLMALIAITGALIAARYNWLTQLPETRRLVYVLLLVLGSSVLFLVTSFVITGFNLAHRLPQKFPARDKLIEISEAYHLYARHWKATLVGFAMSLVAHLGTFATFLCVAYALHAAVPVIDFFAVMPIERTISSLPISFGGAGWREIVLEIMLHRLAGVQQGVAPLIGSLSFLIILLCCLPGGLVYFLYKPRGATRHVRMSEMRDEVATLEHGIASE
ncbi:MAG TPA: lysylphosphatidylglycerol synthase transmembrane domain-containing protein, partial [Chthoniobacterales bacterium]|nr:lysylphosphatidylglycerol synthase transmembrane domain-containing protein [Chthoniobacterales bacterium]